MNMKSSKINMQMKTMKYLENDRIIIIEIGMMENFRKGEEEEEEDKEVVVVEEEDFKKDKRD